MSDVADEIRKTIQGVGAPPGTLKHLVGQPEEDFMKLRAHVYGTLLYAHRQLSGDEFSVIDDRILSAVLNWMESKRTK